MTAGRKLWVPVLACVFPGAALLADNEMQHLRQKIGDTEFVQIDSPRPYPAGRVPGDIVWSQTLSKAGATFVKIHFTKDTLLDAAGEDLLIVRDQDGHAVHAFRGREASDHWTISMPGESATIELYSGPGGGGEGVSIDIIGWGFLPLDPDDGGAAGNSYYSICNAVVPSRIRKADPVCRLVWVGDCGGVFNCTGWLFSPHGHLMTNAHCANSASESNSLEARFNWMPFQCALAGKPIPDIYNNNSFVSMSCNLDMAIHLIHHNTKGNPASVYGYLELNYNVPSNGTEVWLPQHPGGSQKQIDENCFVTNPSVGGSNFCADPPGCNASFAPTGTTSLFNSCDVAGGSSGSPLLNTQDKVVALIDAEPGGGGGSIGVRMFNIKNSLPDLPLWLDLAGPATVNETQTAQFTVQSNLLVSGVKNVVNFATFQVNPPAAGSMQAGGVFVPGDVPADTLVTITATFTAAGFSVQDSTTILVIDEGPQGPVMNVTLHTDKDLNRLCPDDQFDVDVVISSTKPVMDVRLLQFDSVLTQGLTINSVTWDMQSLASMTLYFQVTTTPVFQAAYIALSSLPGFIINTNETQQVVARLNVTYHGGDAELDICGVDDPPSTDFSVRFQAGFQDLLFFDKASANVNCIPLVLSESTDACHVVLNIVNSDPPDNAIDARQPFKPDGSDPAGWNAITLEFDGDPSGLTAADFTLSEQGGDGIPPGIVSVVSAGPNALTVNFDQFIQFGAWTTITYNANGQSVRIGYLPADVNADHTAAVPDVLALINHLNGVVTYPPHSTDIDRSGVTSSPDVLRVIDLLNGAGAYPVFNGMTLP